MKNFNADEVDWARRNQEGIGRPVVRERYNNRKLTNQQIAEEYDEYDDGSWYDTVTE